MREYRSLFSGKHESDFATLTATITFPLADLRAENLFYITFECLTNDTELKPTARIFSRTNKVHRFSVQRLLFLTYS